MKCKKEENGDRTISLSYEETLIVANALRELSEFMAGNAREEYQTRTGFSYDQVKEFKRLFFGLAIRQQKSK